VTRVIRRKYVASSTKSHDKSSLRWPLAKLSCPVDGCDSSDQTFDTCLENAQPQSGYCEPVFQRRAIVITFSRTTRMTDFIYKQSDDSCERIISDDGVGFIDLILLF